MGNILTIHAHVNERLFSGMLENGLAFCDFYAFFSHRKNGGAQ